MHRVQQQLTSWIVSSLADVADVKPESIQGPLLLGSGELENVRLRLHRINDQLPPLVPLECVGAAVEKLKISVPWLSLSHKPIAIEVSGVDLLFLMRPAKHNPHTVAGMGNAAREQRLRAVVGADAALDDAASENGSHADGNESYTDAASATDTFKSCVSPSSFASCRSDTGSVSDDPSSPATPADEAAAAAAAAAAAQPTGAWHWLSSAVVGMLPIPAVITNPEINITIRDVRAAVQCGDFSFVVSVEAVDVVVFPKDASKPRDVRVRGVSVAMQQLSTGAAFPLVKKFDLQLSINVVPPRPGHAGHTHTSVTIPKVISVDVSERIIAKVSALAAATKREFAVPPLLRPLQELRLERKWWHYAIAATLADIRDRRQRWNLVPSHLRTKRFQRNALRRLLVTAFKDPQQYTTVFQDILDVEDELKFVDVVHFMRYLAQLDVGRDAVRPRAGEEQLGASASVGVFMKGLSIALPCESFLAVEEVELQLAPIPDATTAEVDTHSIRVKTVQWLAGDTTLLACTRRAATNTPAVSVNVRTAVKKQERKRVSGSGQRRQTLTVHNTVRINAAPVAMNFTMAYFLRLLVAFEETSLTLVTLIVPPPATVVRDASPIRVRSRSAPRRTEADVQLHMEKTTVTVDDWVRVEFVSLHAHGLPLSPHVHVVGATVVHALPLTKPRTSREIAASGPQLQKQNSSPSRLRDAKGWVPFDVPTLTTTPVPHQVVRPFDVTVHKVRGSRSAQTPEQIVVDVGAVNADIGDGTILGIAALKDRSLEFARAVQTFGAKLVRRAAAPDLAFGAAASDRAPSPARGHQSSSDLGQALHVSVASLECEVYRLKSTLGFSQLTVDQDGTNGLRLHFGALSWDAWADAIRMADGEPVPPPAAAQSHHTSTCCTPKAGSPTSAAADSETLPDAPAPRQLHDFHVVLIRDMTVVKPMPTDDDPEPVAVTSWTFGIALGGLYLPVWDLASRPTGAAPEHRRPTIAGTVGLNSHLDSLDVPALMATIPFFITSWNSLFELFEYDLMESLQYKEFLSGYTQVTWRMISTSPDGAPVKLPNGAVVRVWIHPDQPYVLRTVVKPEERTMSVVIGDPDTPCPIRIVPDVGATNVEFLATLLQVAIPNRIEQDWWEVAPNVPPVPPISVRATLSAAAGADTFFNTVVDGLRLRLKYPEIDVGYDEVAIMLDEAVVVANEPSLQRVCAGLAGRLVHEPAMHSRHASLADACSMSEDTYGVSSLPSGATTPRSGPIVPPGSVPKQLVITSDIVEETLTAARRITFSRTRDAILRRVPHVIVVEECLLSIRAAGALRIDDGVTVVFNACTISLGFGLGAIEDAVVQRGTGSLVVTPSCTVRLYDPTSSWTSSLPPADKGDKNNAAAPEPAFAIDSRLRLRVDGGALRGDMRLMDRVSWRVCARHIVASFAVAAPVPAPTNRFILANAQPILARTTAEAKLRIGPSSILRVDMAATEARPHVFGDETLIDVTAGLELDPVKPPAAASSTAGAAASPQTAADKPNGAAAAAAEKTEAPTKCCVVGVHLRLELGFGPMTLPLSAIEDFAALTHFVAVCGRIAESAQDTSLLDPQPAMRVNRYRPLAAKPMESPATALSDLPHLTLVVAFAHPWIVTLATTPFTHIARAVIPTGTTTIASDPDKCQLDVHAAAQGTLALYSLRDRRWQTLLHEVGVSCRLTHRWGSVRAHSVASPRLAGSPRGSITNISPPPTPRATDGSVSSWTPHVSLSEGSHAVGHDDWKQQLSLHVTRVNIDVHHDMFVLISDVVRCTASFATRFVAGGKPLPPTAPLRLIDATGLGFTVGILDDDRGGSLLPDTRLTCPPLGEAEFFTNTCDIGHLGLVLGATSTKAAPKRVVLGAPDVSTGITTLLSRVMHWPNGASVVLRVRVDAEVQHITLMTPLVVHNTLPYPIQFGDGHPVPAHDTGSVGFDAMDAPRLQLRALGTNLLQDPVHTFDVSGRCIAQLAAAHRPLSYVRRFDLCFRGRDAARDCLYAFADLTFDAANRMPVLSLRPTLVVHNATAIPMRLVFFAAAHEAETWASVFSASPARGGDVVTECIVKAGAAYDLLLHDPTHSLALQVLTTPDVQPPVATSTHPVSLHQPERDALGATAVQAGVLGFSSSADAPAERWPFLSRHEEPGEDDCDVPPPGASLSAHITASLINGCQLKLTSSGFTVLKNRTREAVYAATHDGIPLPSLTRRDPERQEVIAPLNALTALCLPGTSFATIDLSSSSSGGLRCPSNDNRSYGALCIPAAGRDDVRDCTIEPFFAFHNNTGHNLLVEHCPIIDNEVLDRSPHRFGIPANECYFYCRVFGDHPDAFRVCAPVGGVDPVDWSEWFDGAVSSAASRSLNLHVSNKPAMVATVFRKEPFGTVHVCIADRAPPLVVLSNVSSTSIAVTAPNGGLSVDPFDMRLQPRQASSFTPPLGVYGQAARMLTIKAFDGSAVSLMLNHVQPSSTGGEVERRGSISVLTQSVQAGRGRRGLQYLIVVLDTPPDVPPLVRCPVATNLFQHLDSTAVSVSVESIDIAFLELCEVGILRLTSKVEQLSSKRNVFEANCVGLQIRDLSNAVEDEYVLHPCSVDAQMTNIGLEMLPRTSNLVIGSCRANIAPRFEFVCSDDFVIALQRFFTLEELFAHKGKRALTQHPPPPAPLPRRASSPALPVTEIILTLAIGKMRVGTLDAVLSWRRTGHGDNVLWRRLVVAWFVHSVHRAALSMPQMRLDDFFGHPAELGRKVVRHYVESVASQWRALVCSNELVGAPIALVGSVVAGVGDLISQPAGVGVPSMLRHTIWGAAAAVSSVFGGVATAINRGPAAREVAAAEAERRDRDALETMKKTVSKSSLEDDESDGHPASASASPNPRTPVPVRRMKSLQSSPVGLRHARPSRSQAPYDAASVEPNAVRGTGWICDDPVTTVRHTVTLGMAPEDAVPAVISTWGISGAALGFPLRELLLFAPAATVLRCLGVMLAGAQLRLAYREVLTVPFPDCAADDAAMLSKAMSPQAGDRRYETLEQLMTIVTASAAGTPGGPFSVSLLELCRLYRTSAAYSEAGSTPAVPHGTAQMSPAEASATRYVEGYLRALCEDEKRRAR